MNGTCDVKLKDLVPCAVLKGCGVLRGDVKSCAVQCGVAAIETTLCLVSFILMGRLRLVGSLKLQVSFAKEPYKRDYILQKRPMIWARGGEAHRAEAAVHHQGRSK